ncbi:hypothetical protein GGD64_006730 [Bradyrhizobium sp. CIR3A]|nr:hypothetical protein [Bradyrhizobium sp. CIR3A]
MTPIVYFDGHLAAKGWHSSVRPTENSKEWTDSVLYRDLSLPIVNKKGRCQDLS